jgi:muramoyltetrapeptide carboxypeptidase LdcA involved in peptidoglycan recycling
MSLYENPDVAAIIPPWGGEFLMDMLPHLDFKRLSELPPKWVCGYSDLSTLTFPLTVMCDMATVHGSNFMNMGYDEIHESDLAAFDVISKPESTQRSSECFGEYFNWLESRRTPYNLTKKTVWKSLSGEPSHTLAGRMLGGCMDTLCKLLGTRFAPVQRFLERYKDDGFIWTLESCEMNAGDIYRTLWQMKECGWFAHCSGFLIGRPAGYSDTNDFTFIDALEKGLGGLDVPVIYDADIGHMPPLMQIVNGAYGMVEYENGSATVRQKHRT